MVSVGHIAMVDISHDARWGRVKEGAGEDPFLGGIMAQAWVRGYQGNDLSADTTLMACVKHYALYGAAEAGRDYNTVDMSRVTAMNYYMRPYQAAVEAGVGSIMTSFNEFESIPRPEILGFLMTCCVNNGDLTALSCLILRQ